MPIAATTIGSDDQLCCLWVALLTHAEPPPPDGLHGKCRGVMVGAHTHPGFICTNIVNPVRIGAPEFLVDEVVNLDLDRLTAGQPLLPCVFVGTHQLLL